MATKRQYDSAGVPFPDYEIHAIYAEMVCAALLLITAIAATLMVIRKSWLKHDGRRIKKRLSMFLGCLVSIIVYRALVIADAVLQFQGFYLYPVWGYYQSNSFILVSSVGGVFDLMSLILFFAIVLAETSSWSVQNDHARTLLHPYGLAFVLFSFSALGLSCWVLNLLLGVQMNGILYYVNFSYAALVGLSISSACTALFFAVAVMFRACVGTRRSFNLPDKSILKAQSKHLRHLTYALCLAQVLYAVQDSFTVLGVSFAAVKGIRATNNIVWIYLVLVMALLARCSFNLNRADIRCDEPVIVQQPDYQASSWHRAPPQQVDPSLRKMPVVLTTRNDEM